MFYRNIISHLEKWSKKSNRKPLVLRGARQVGKTTVVKQFSEQYATFLYMNLEKDEHRNLFENGYSLEDVLLSIYLINEKTKDKSKTLLFIDEIQHSPRAVAMLRYFHEELPHIHVIAAGSLLETMIGKNISFPVGRVEYAAMRPCSFNEFLNALGHKQYNELLNNCEVPEILHKKFTELFNRFTLIGGMPEVVAHYAGNQDLVSIRTIYNSLLTGFIDDTEKYARNQTQTHVLRHILKTGFAYNCERIKFERFGESDYRSREVGEAFRTLEKTMLLELVWPVTAFNLPIKPDLKKSPRLMWLDSGLVNYFGGIQKEVLGSPDISDAWRGRVAEQIVGQEIIAGDTSVLRNRNFWVREARNSNAEVDYIIQHDGKLIPVEVKSGLGTRLRSLHLFMDNSNHDIAIRFWSNPMKIDNIVSDSGKKYRLINLPFYYSGYIHTILKKVL